MNHKKRRSKKRIKRISNRRLYFIIYTVMIALFIIVYILMLPTSLVKNIGNVNQKSAKPTTVSLLGLKVPDQKSAKPLPGFTPDYAIPPIQNGMAPVITNIPTKQNVVFLTIDDGAFKDQSVVDMIKQNGIKASLFLSKVFIDSNPDFFKQIISLGSLVEDHTIGHDTNMVKNQGYDQQKAEICDMANYEVEHYGRRPIFFRPPGGAYSDTMRRAAADCGMKAVVTWIAKANGGSMQYQIGSKLRPGDIVLMHFRPEFKQDMQAFLNAQDAAGLHTELLEDLVVN
ncbi:MAG: polysaccharide deacetylase family protein [Candidatus Saccharibacteria bacterium]